MADSVDRVFVHALNTVKKLPRSGSSRPPPEDRLKLYGLYKQSMEGDVDGVMPRPTGLSDEEVTEARKWDSWHEQKGLSKTEAKRRYITTLIDAMHRFAVTTPDAKELVAELEFVWDQIKSNQTSSSSSTTAAPAQQQQTLLSSAATTPRRQPASGLSHSQNISATGLQILPPMSPTEEGRRFTNFPPVGMGVQTDSEETGNRPDTGDDDEDEDEHYETMDEFDENGLPKVTVINEPAGFKEGGNTGNLIRSINTQTAVGGGGGSGVESDILRQKKQHIKHLSSSQFTTTKKSLAALSSTGSMPRTNPQQQPTNGQTPRENAHYTRWKQRVEVALTKMTAEVAALREQLDVARNLNGGGMNLSRGRLNWIRRWIGWGVWTVLKHIVIDAILIGVLVVWMRKRGDKRVEGVLGLLGGFLSERLRLKKDVPDVGRTFVIA
ncbi:hypothetical protein TWF569_009870 [Orbilia oligospora]|uniref:ACB domain-containing protein n=2 Tax=Orbilia oligospora TaxID=2813651 RepID=A0A7C8JDJ4_ORBOL|nr:hypothetical protein TWF102_006826 [Orbilia oligospora]KAF3101340.1 hypothetical protein TWF706_005634 [Orbilia oligospora]KAF3103656.1 hypothetical protein TWF103_007167 [Orbilia oligospora]KAF3135527.1 hypothetical protein TWF569_009870 [Orbilia oligospora]KAF3142593.1 hypothetical protein TWF594_005481 [Orbilia oligospora]